MAQQPGVAQSTPIEADQSSGIAAPSGGALDDGANRGELVNGHPTPLSDEHRLADDRSASPRPARQEPRQHAAPKAIALCSSSSPAWDRLADGIRSLGIALEDAADRADLPALLEGSRRTPVLVYQGDDITSARDVLEWLDSRCLKRAVIAVVDRSDFSQYNELMHSGAAEYFEVSEQPERVATAIQRANDGRCS